MQISSNPLSHLFSQQGLIHLAYKVITYIDLQTLFQVIDEQQPQNQTHSPIQTEIVPSKYKCHSKIKHLIQSHYLLKEYLNKTDRSMYFAFYDQPLVRSVSAQLQENIVMQQTINNFTKTKLSDQFEHLHKLFWQVQNLQLLNEQQQQQLKRILADPSLPLPPLKRQNQGTHCNSSFQLFLVGLKFPHHNQQSFTPFEQFREKIQSEQDANFKQFLQIQKQKHSSIKPYQNLHLVRYTPYQITVHNFQSLTLDNNSLHNLVVMIFALTDVWIESVLQLVNSIDDPFYQFVELLTRLATFRSFVMEVQDSLGFVFQAYDNLYDDTVRDSLFMTSNLKPKFCFWRPALAKWFLKMSPIHSRTNQVYFLLLTKLRQQALLDKLNTPTPSPAWKPAKKHLITLQNNLLLHLLSDKLQHHLHQSISGSSIFEQLISDNPQTCQALLFEYVEYFIDLAVNEQTVHWCGHSNHRLGEPFNLFNSQFILYNNSFVANLKQKVLGDIAQKDTMKVLLQLFIQSDLQFLQQKNVKPVMLRPFVDDINKKGKFFQDLLQKSTQQKSLFDQKIPSDQNPIEPSKQPSHDIIFVNFNEKDQRLKYFNDKAKIFQQIEGEEKCFFSIPPLLSPQEILAKSINTNDTNEHEECDEIDSSFEYVSDDDECEEVRMEIKEDKVQDQSLEQKLMMKSHKANQVKKKVNFQTNSKENSQSSQKQKKTLYSTQPSTKDSNNFSLSEQNQKSPIKNQQLLITKSQSI